MLCLLGRLGQDKKCALVQVHSLRWFVVCRVRYIAPVRDLWFVKTPAAGAGAKFVQGVCQTETYRPPLAYLHCPGVFLNYESNHT